MQEPAKTLQIELFQHLKNLVPENLNYIYVVGEILNIAENAVYKRVRGEQAISLEEFVALKIKFPMLNLVTSTNIRTRKLFVEYSNIGHKKYTLHDQLKDVSAELSIAMQDEGSIIYYAAKDLPVFYFYLFPELAAFRFYSLKKNVLFSKDYLKKKFSIKTEIALPEIATAQEIWQKFSLINSAEIWCNEILSSTINQLKFAKETEQFADTKDYFLLLEKLNEIIELVEQQAEQGFKQANQQTQFELFNHEMLFMQNVSLFKLHQQFATFLMHNATNIFIVDDFEMGKETMTFLDKIMKQSSPLSLRNSKERLIYFNKLRTQIKEAAK